MSKVGFTVKAAQLVSSGVAKDYPHACSLLAKRYRPRPKAPLKTNVRYWWNSDN